MRCQTGAVNQLQWLNRSHPPTLRNASVLAYIRAVFVLLYLGRNVEVRLLTGEIFDIVGLGSLGWDLAPIMLLAGLALGGLFTANDKKAGFLALAGTALYTVVADFYFMYRLSTFFDASLLINLMFDGVLVVLLLHPMTTSYRKIWFS